MRRIFVATLVIVAAIVWVGSSRPSAQGTGNNQFGAEDPHQKGTTYYALEAATGRLTTRYANGHVATATRDNAGTVTTNLHDQSGNALQQHIGGRTLDEGTAQTHNGEVTEVVTEWAEGLTATLTKQTYSRRELGHGRFVGGPAYVTNLTLNGVPAGIGVWFVADRVYAYSLPGLGADFIAPEHLKQRYGDWGFTPDPIWVNLQTIAIHHFTTLSKAKGFVAKNNGSCGAAATKAVAQFFFPTVQANEPGCDGLHWLDGTVVRACCDDHDRCYARNGCTSSSWWTFWRSWSCDFCNMSVVGCFAAGGEPPACALMRLAC
jgi:hypothetical protein